MNDNEIEKIMCKYLEYETSEEETHIVLDHLIVSERERHIINLAAAGLRCMQLEQNLIDMDDDRIY